MEGLLGEAGITLHTRTRAHVDGPRQLRLEPSNIDLHSGHVFNVSLTYNGTVLQETVTDATTGATYVHNYTVNIPALVGGNTAFVGFTGATGGCTCRRAFAASNRAARFAPRSWSR